MLILFINERTTSAEPSHGCRWRNQGFILAILPGVYIRTILHRIILGRPLTIYQLVDLITYDYR
jgi:hypothetical protein